MAIKMIRLLFALPIDSREFVFLRKARERWGGGWQGAINDDKKNNNNKKPKQCRQKSNDSLPKLIYIL